MENLFKIIKEYLYNYIVNKADFTEDITKPELSRIYYKDDIFSDKDYLTIDFNAIKTLYVFNEVNIEATQETHTIKKECILTIKYVGKNAYDKLEYIFDKMGIRTNGDDFLKNSLLQVALYKPENILNLSKLIEDDKIEFASFDVKLFFKTSLIFTKDNLNIENIETNYNI
jgi:hypothetical protein